MAIEPGALAPDFELQDSTGQNRRLSEFRGRKVVLYFYPKDDTPGCTKEACSFRDNLERIANLGAVVVGVSPDRVESHGRFAAKYGLSFPLLADSDARVAQAYGVWVKKSMYGREYMGIERTTFVIDEGGVVRRVFPKVKVAGHVDEVVRALESST